MLSLTLGKQADIDVAKKVNKSTFNNNLRKLFKTPLNILERRITRTSNAKTIIYF